jgi:hypothetical protein
MADAFANLNIKGPLLQKWMKKGSATRRRRKLAQINKGERLNSPLTPGASEPPHTKELADSMYNGRLQYLTGFITQASPREMRELRTKVELISTSKQKNHPIIKLFKKIPNNNGTAKNRTHHHIKDIILFFISLDDNHRNTISASLFNIIYDALPSRY